jgi:membrane-bound metal-dependent hydrolase YbcI (DUF457 family)
MDTIAHALLGAAIGVVAQHVGAADAGGPSSPTGQALFWGSMIAAQAPDLDLVTMVRNRLNHIKHHHGLTHSLGGGSVLAAAVAGLACLVWPGASFAVLYPWMLLAMVGGHIVPDWLTPFGTRLLLPFRNKYFALDWLAQSEPFMTGVLLLSVVTSLRSAPAWAPLWAGAGLSVSVLFVLWRGYNHRRICLRVRRAYTARGYEVLRVVSQPHPWGVNRYSFTVDTPGFCHLGTAWLGGPVEEQSRVERPQPEPSFDAVAGDTRVAGILRFTRFPIVRARRQPEGGWLFEVSDFRGSCAFHFAIRADRHLKVHTASRAHLPTPSEPLPDAAHTGAL